MKLLIACLLALLAWTPAFAEEGYCGTQVELKNTVTREMLPEVANKLGDMLSIRGMAMCMERFEAHNCTGEISLDLSWFERDGEHYTMKFRYINDNCPDEQGI